MQSQEVAWVITVESAVICLSVLVSFYRPSVILGVTNPFFAKTLQHWPHIIRIGDMKQAGR